VNFLIIAGLLVVALLAILGAVLLGIREQRTEKARSNGRAMVSSTSVNPVVERQPAVSRTAEQSTATRQALPSQAEKRGVSTEDSQQAFALNGQFHELSVELQTLYHHAYELERRLRTLSEVADRIEKTQSHQNINEEEISH
jgi:hypothetical protein